MPPLKSNKLIPLLAGIVIAVILIIFWRTSHDGSAVKAGDPLKSVPSSAKDLGEKGGNWLVGRAKEDASLPADADTPNETLKTLSAQVGEMKSEMRRITDENSQLRVQLRNEQATGTGTGTNKQSSDPIAPLSNFPAPVKSDPAAVSATANVPSPSSNDGKILGKGKLAGLLSDFGFGGADAGNANTGNVSLNPATMTPVQQQDGSAPMQPQGRTVLPMGYGPGKGANGHEGMVRMTPTGMPATASTASYSQVANAANSAMPEMIDPATGQVQGGDKSPSSTQKSKDKPYWTIPENATLMGATAMTAIVGRVPVDGRVQDPMQFKLLLGPTNLAANGHFLPPDLAGIVVSGIAIGDMTLSCSEGVIQSLTFVFNDGSIRTVSSAAGGGGSMGSQGTASGSGISNMAKLGFLSDRYGNPCISGKFVTNAPAFLTDVVGLKTLALAGKAAAGAQTTTSNNSIGTSSSTVTGSKGTYILGETVAGATDAVTDWLTRRMGNSFDAVVTAAGAEVVIHINREISIDKTANARKIDYGRVDSVASHSRTNGVRHGLD